METFTYNGRQVPLGAKTECPDCGALIVMSPMTAEELTQVLLENPVRRCRCGVKVPHDVYFDALEKYEQEKGNE